MTGPAQTLIGAIRSASACLERLLPARIYRRHTQLGSDAFIAAISLVLAYEIHFGFDVPKAFAGRMWGCVTLFSILRPASLLVSTRYRTIWKFVNLHDAIKLATTAFAVSSAIFLITLSKDDNPLSFDLLLLDFCLFVVFAISVRVLRRVLCQHTRMHPLKRKRALLVGTEEIFGPAIAQVRAYPEIELVGLIAAGGHLKSLRVSGLPIVGDPRELESIIPGLRIDVVLAADATLDCIPHTVAVAAHFGIQHSVLPSVANVLRDEVRVARLIKADAAFGTRELSSSFDPAVLDCFRNRAVFITGAGGSIGSELSRQARTLGISRLILLDRDENSVFEIHRELASKACRPELLPIVGDFRDSALLKSVFATYRPDIVLHCGAYKHVPLMQTNISEAVLNNVIGTRDLADTAMQFGVERFVMISSDKAVRPSSVMGATKRAAELLLQSRARLSSGTRFASVRFGNVAGTRGSVIPIFLRQIEEGKPVTITDERMTRYFMTIAEAVQLVIRASTLADEGEIYVLEMGRPVAVKTLANNLILMSGQRPGRDIPINVVGIRPGEKLHEQLCCDDDRLLPTEFERVYRAVSDELPDDIEQQVERLEIAARRHLDVKVLEELSALPIGFRESHSA